MIRFKTIILKFQKQGEKTGWTYIEVPAELAQQLKPGNKKTFRVKGKLDNYSFQQVALLPMGNGTFIMALNATMRKNIGKKQGHSVVVQMEHDQRPLQPSADFIACLADDAAAAEFFKSLAKSHQDYFTKWIESAKTDQTKAGRIAHSINYLSRKQGFGEMLRDLKRNREELKKHV
jgi:hypothetical protein